MTTGPIDAQTQTPEEVLAAVTDYLAEYPQCLLLESGALLFDLGEASRSLACTQGKVVLHLWSAERNQVRRITSAVRRGSILRLSAHRFGQREPESLELVRERGRRGPVVNDDARSGYLRLLDRVLRRSFPELSPADLRASTDLEHSFGPAYARGQQMRGSTVWAVIGVSAEESTATIDGILTVGILWLALCRERAGGRRVVEGLRLIVPRGAAETTLSRLLWMDARIAKYAIHELDEATETLTELDLHDRGNGSTRLPYAPNQDAAVGDAGRFQEAIPRVLALLPPAALRQPEERATAHSRERPPATAGDEFEMRLRSGAELLFLRHGLEFARIRLSFNGQSFNRTAEVTLGAGMEETPLTESNAGAMRLMVHELFARRRAASPRSEFVNDQRDPLFRLQPERWLESLLRADLAALDPQLQPAPVYVQVPVIAGGSDRGTLDLLAVTTGSRLAVIEVKAEEDLQLAMQGLDYWIRVRDHHLSSADPATGLGDLQQRGYFPQTRLLPESPLLYLVAPALRIHPATETVLRHFDPRVPWTLIALDERWRTRIRPVWRRGQARWQAVR